MLVMIKQKSPRSLAWYGFDEAVGQVVDVHEEKSYSSAKRTYVHRLRVCQCNDDFFNRKYKDRQEKSKFINGRSKCRTMQYDGLTIREDDIIPLTENKDLKVTLTTHEDDAYVR